MSAAELPGPAPRPRSARAARVLLWVSLVIIAALYTPRLVTLFPLGNDIPSHEDAPDLP